MVISKTEYDQWTNAFLTAWKQRSVASVMKLIAPDCQYYETVFNKPCISIEQIKRLWEVVPNNQKNISFKYDIIAFNEKFCIVNFFLKRTLIPQNTTQNINGIFQISLNKSMQCTFFKQWRSVEEI